MNQVLDTSEVLGTAEVRGGTFEVCASANANYDEASARLVVQLDSFLRTIELQTKEERLSADWLPKPETITESIGSEEATIVARDIFKSWVRKVRQATPSLREQTHQQ